MRKRRTKITIETERVIVIRKRRPLTQEWCNRCGEIVSMVTVDEAAGIAGVSSRTIYRWVEADRIHFTETSDRRLLICPDSLPTAGFG
jgi:excisionase family DNA binding protein